MSVKENLEQIRENVVSAMARAGRNDDILLLAVTKTYDNSIIEEVVNYGITDIGENKVQELVKRIDYFGDKFKYHQIGALQSNKVKYIVDRVKLIHSLDRLSLAEELQKRANLHSGIDCLLEVNVSKESSKSGIFEEDLIPFIEKILEYDRINVMGLMTMAPYTDDKKIIRNCFKNLYKLKEKIEDRHYEKLSMKYLSMGMSNDYEIAVEEGSNILRIGTALFGKRDYK